MGSSHPMAAFKVGNVPGRLRNPTPRPSEPRTRRDALKNYGRGRPRGAQGHLGGFEKLEIPHAPETAGWAQKAQNRPSATR